MPPLMSKNLLPAADIVNADFRLPRSVDLPVETWPLMGEPAVLHGLDGDLSWITLWRRVRPADSDEAIQWTRLSHLFQP